MAVPAELRAQEASCTFAQEHLTFSPSDSPSMSLPNRRTHGRNPAPGWRLSTEPSTGSERVRRGDAASLAGGGKGRGVGMVCRQKGLPIRC